MGFLIILWVSCIPLELTTYWVSEKFEKKNVAESNKLEEFSLAENVKSTFTLKGKE